MRGYSWRHFEKPFESASVAWASCPYHIYRMRAGSVEFRAVAGSAGTAGGRVREVVIGAGRLHRLQAPEDGGRRFARLPRRGVVIELVAAERVLRPQQSADLRGRGRTLAG